MPKQRGLDAHQVLLPNVLAVLPSIPCHPAMPDAPHLRPVTPEEIADACPSRSPNQGRKRVNHADTMMARITDDRLVHHLTASGFVLMKGAPAAAPPTVGSLQPCGIDRWLRHPLSVVGRQTCGRQLRVLQTHRVWNESRIGGCVTPASARTVRRPGQPSVKAVISVSSFGPAVSTVRRIRAVMSVSALHDAENLAATSLRFDVADADLKVAFALFAAADEGRVESKLTVMADAAATGLSAAASPSCLPTCSVWLRNVSGLFPVSIGSRCSDTSVATR
jgi:hypothetical protein